MRYAVYYNDKRTSEWQNTLQEAEDIRDAKQTLFITPLTVKDSYEAMASMKVQPRQVDLTELTGV